jgi:hypothetical protein
MLFGAWQGKLSLGIIFSKVFTNIVDIIAGGAAHSAKC